MDRSDVMDLRKRYCRSDPSGIENTSVFSCVKKRWKFSGHGVLGLTGIFECHRTLETVSDTVVEANKSRPI